MIVFLIAKVSNNCGGIFIFFLLHLFFEILCVIHVHIQNIYIIRWAFCIFLNHFIIFIETKLNPSSFFFAFFFLKVYGNLFSVSFSTFFFSFLNFLCFIQEFFNLFFFYLSFFSFNQTINFSILDFAIAIFLKH